MPGLVLLHISIGDIIVSVVLAVLGIACLINPSKGKLAWLAFLMFVLAIGLATLAMTNPTMWVFVALWVVFFTILQTLTKSK